MACGKCKDCVPEDTCGCDCHCTAKDIEISQNDEIQFYGERDNEDCEKFSSAE